MEKTQGLPGLQGGLVRFLSSGGILLGTFALAACGAWISGAWFSGGLCVGLAALLLLVGGICLLSCQDKRRPAALCLVTNALAGGCVIGWGYVGHPLPPFPGGGMLALGVVMGLYGLAWAAVKCRTGKAALYGAFVLAALGAGMGLYAGAKTGSPAEFAFFFLIFFAPYLIWTFPVAHTQRSALLCYAYAGFSALALVFAVVALLVSDDAPDWGLENLLSISGKPSGPITSRRKEP